MRFPIMCIKSPVLQQGHWQETYIIIVYWGGGSLTKILADKKFFRL